jgi:hypothetical protein
MIGFNLLNQTAARHLLQETHARGIGVEVMFAVRRVLSDPRALVELVAVLVKEGRIAPDAFNPEDPRGFLVHDGGPQSVVEAAYRFARHQVGAHVVLTGTGSMPHAEVNVGSIISGPLLREDLEKIGRLFGHLDHLTGN